MGLNAELLYARIHEIEQSLERLDEIATVSQETFLSNPDLKDIACYRLIVAIESALQICFHISSKLLKKVPDSYSDCFGLLEEGDILPKELSTKLRQMARFRNLLIHMYWQVDYERVYEFIQNSRGDLREFISLIRSLI
ncbi:MAG: DUF86 domain-containing protein [Anaerolineales bacterium]